MPGKELVGHAGDGDVGAMEVNPGRDLVALLAEVVDDPDLVAALDQLTRDLAADEPGASGDHDSLLQTDSSIRAQII